MVPVVGEAVPIPFNEQIELDEWDWTLENEEYVDKQTAREKAVGKSAADDKGGPKKSFNQAAAKKLAADVSKTQLDASLSVEQKERKVRELMNGLVQKVGADDRAGEADDKKNEKGSEDDGDEGKLQFTFKKNVDAATTQLLNSMKAGDLMPRAIVTLFHRSTNAPVTLAIKFENVRLKEYKLSVDPSETMSDLKEEWTASYQSVEYTYQNRPAASGPNGLTKGTVRVFKKKGGSLI